MWKEFKEFITRGNVIDLAIGMVMGSAFTAIVNSLVDDIISPLIGLIIGETDFSSWVVNVGTAEFRFGAFLNTIVTFLLISLVLFFIIKGINKARDVLSHEEEKKEQEEEAKEPELSTEESLLVEIRDLLAKESKTDK